MTFGENLTNLRKSKGMSQEQLAEQLDLTRQTISKWELGQSTPDVSLLLQLSDIFQVSIDCLIKGESGDASCSESDISKSPAVSTPVLSVAAYKWSFCLGTVFAAVSFVGVLVLVICSVLHPWTTIIDGKSYEGLMGFLLGTHSLWFFIVLLVLFFLGCGAAVYAIVKDKKQR